MSWPGPAATPVGSAGERELPGGLVPESVSSQAIALDEQSAGRRGWLVRRALVCADLLGLAGAFALSEAIYRGVPNQGNALGTGSEYLVFFASLPLWIVAAKIYGLYDRDESRADHSTADDIVRVFHLVTIVAWLLVAGAYLTGIAQPAFTKVATFWALAIPVVVVARAFARAVCRRMRVYLQNTIIVGAGDVGQMIAAKLLRHPEYGIRLLGFVDDRPKEQRPGLETMTLLGPPDRLSPIVRDHGVERVIVAFSNDSFERTADLIRSLHDLEVQIDVVPRLFDLVSPSAEIHTVEGIPLLGIPSLHLSRSSAWLKRVMDVVLAALGLVVLSPLLVLLAIAIKIDSKGPVFFRQTRMGAGGKTFRIFKLRTMVADAEHEKDRIRHLNKHLAPGADDRMFKIPDDPRVTRVGGFLRAYSIDEVPQLINVLRGEMSLVGPRPLILDEDRYVDSWARRRMDLKPGITGLWQVLGRSDIPFDEMVKLDYLYVTTWSLWQDVRLLFRTIPVLAGSRGGSY
jgi:exopolysaccharide biosynthesis polyprenyl glycosylphosphotransferase